MSNFKFALLYFALVTLALPAGAAPRIDGTDGVKSESESKPILLAQKKKKKAATGNKKGVRERIMSREASGKFKKDADARNIDFDAVDIGGQRKTPMGSLVSQSKADKEYDFVKIRLRWHAEMFQSASSLESGGN